VAVPDLAEPASSSGVLSTRHTVIEPPSGWQGLGFGEIWQYRELLRALAGRDVKLRYKQTVLGFAWCVLQPFLYMVVFSALLAGVGGVTGENGIPYPIFTYSGLLIWLYFADALTRSSTSLVTNNVLVSKVYFPRLTAPLSGVVSPMLDFVIGSVMLVGIMIYYSFPLTSAFLLVPLFLVLAVLAAAAFGIWLSAINVRYRDVGYAMPFVVQIWMFVSPVVYSASKVHGKARYFYSLNPMAGVVSGFRYAVLGSGTLDWVMVGIGTAVSVAVLTGGLLYFRRVERTFADAI